MDRYIEDGQGQCSWQLLFVSTVKITVKVYLLMKFFINFLVSPALFSFTPIPHMIRDLRKLEKRQQSVWILLLLFPDRIIYKYQILVKIVKFSCLFES